AEYAPQDLDAADRALLVVSRGEHTVTLLNRYPYANAHLLVCPRRHAATLATLSDAEHLEAGRELARWTATLERVVNASGFNVGLNLGAVAGAGVPGHLHWHVLPRWPGDHNFLPTTAGVRVIPQSLHATWSLLREAAT
ncbi:MAG: HIT domain-containing protein, partial [Planctomycetota bacterium]